MKRLFLPRIPRLVVILFVAQICFAEPKSVMICVKDLAGVAIAGASVLVGGAGGASVTDAKGCVSKPIGRDASISASLRGFSQATVPWVGENQLTIVLKLAGRREQVEVTAARTPLSLDADASSVRTLSSEELQQSPGVLLDDRLRQVAGFQLFRRTSSQVANPTTEGTSLRGLGSTAASRTLVLSDQVPLNDGFGGWIHWNEIPQLAIASVEVVRGGASDLYGSSAIGGVIDVLPVVPQARSFLADLSGATQDSFSLSGLGTEVVRRWAMIAATTVFDSNGYILTAPGVRSAVDTSSTVSSQSGRVELRHPLSSDGAIFLRSNVLNEARGNGTPVQTNATRLWRYALGADALSAAAGRFFLRVYGDDQGYRQSFSSIAVDRTSELLTRLQRTPSQQIGGAAQWAKPVHSLTFVAGADALDTRARDGETPVAKGVAQPVTTISARQRDVGEYCEILWQPVGTRPLSMGWSAALSGRVDSFRDFDAHQNGGTAPGSLPEIDETVFDPRLGIVKQVGRAVSLTGSVFRAFRGPTMNELYRTGQVGQQTTEANASLRSERATGFELGGLIGGGGERSLRASYFWTQVNRPVAAVTLSSTATTILLQRENLGQIESRGVTAEWTARPAAWVSVTGGYQFALSTVTRFQVDSTLVGKWTAQVPRNSATMQVRVERGRWGLLAVDGLLSGKQFDDSANAYELHGYAQINAYAEHSFNERFQIYASSQNLLNRSIDAGRTPILTLATPRTVVSGIRIRL